jgi:hypothetical protein
MVCDCTYVLRISLMRSVRALYGSKKLWALGVLGLLGATIGCDGGSVGESAAPQTPPPGMSGQEQAEALKKAYGPKGVPKPTKDGAPAKNP